MSFLAAGPASQPVKIDPAQTHLTSQWKHPSPLIGCRFDPSGRFLFVSAQDNTLQRYDLLTGAKTALTGLQSWCRGIAFAPVALRHAAHAPCGQLSGSGARTATRARRAAAPPGLADRLRGAGGRGRGAAVSYFTPLVRDAWYGGEDYR